MPKTMSYTETVSQENVVILSGHGVLPVKAGKARAITVPVGFTVTVWTWHHGSGAGSSLWTLDDAIGNLIDSGRFEEAFMRVNKDKAEGANLKLPITYEAGESIANLMILPSRNNNTGTAAKGHRLVTVDRVGTLEDFLANLQYECPDGANVHWSACAERVNTRHKWVEVNKGEGAKNILTLADLYYEKEKG